MTVRELRELLDAHAGEEVEVLLAGSVFGRVRSVEWHDGSRRVVIVADEV